MTDLREQLVSPENLSWAWQKARRLYRMADGPVDFGEVTAFELDLENQLKKMARQLAAGTYKLAPIALLPQPKKPDEEGNPRLRQSFHISVRDQVAWIAMVNVIGPFLDSRMPNWSYGHRLYKAAWYEEQEDGARHLELGPYRHSTGHLYRKFKHSWPLFRRHISLTARTMVRGLPDPELLDESERSALNHGDRPSYLDKTSWPDVSSPTLYFASIDLEKFYPKITKAAIIGAIAQYWPEYSSDQWMQGLLNRLLDFQVSPTQSKLLGDPLVQPETLAGPFSGIPTGLMIAGFLSNVAMLPLDSLVEKRIAEFRKIAHFRFVDDHAFLAYDFDDLRSWIRDYEQALKDLAIGPPLAPKKFDPPSMAEAYLVDAREELVASTKAAAQIDGRNPAKLMTKTLALVSELAGADFDILSEDSRTQRLRELEWLLMTELPDNEIRSDTRTAFAAGRIASLIPIAYAPSLDLLEAGRLLAQLGKKSKKDDTRGEGELRLAKLNMLDIRQREIDTYKKRLGHYFKMVHQAFCDHPDKPRLFIRGLDYCRVTGYEGTVPILEWLQTHDTGVNAPLAKYLAPLAIQVISRHITTAVHDATNYGLLDRQRLAAKWYLSDLGKPHARSLFANCLRGFEGDFAGTASKHTFFAAVAYAASANISEHAQIGNNFRKLLEELLSPSIQSESVVWQKSTGHSIGVWTYWLDSLLVFDRLLPGPVWLKTIDSHNPLLTSDWQSIKINPAYLPAKHSAYLEAQGAASLGPTESGWLLDQLTSSNPIDLRNVSPRSAAANRIGKYISEMDRKERHVSLLTWVGALKSNSLGHDPRIGEWTALEILRKLLVEIATFPGLPITILNDLHPANVLLPIGWLTATAKENSSFEHWTWEGWRIFVRGPGQKVTVAKSLIRDFRRQPTASRNSDEPQGIWQRQLRGAGLLLLGMLARDFRLPAKWNIRGMERDTAAYVNSALENLAISSKTHAILEAALLPRSVETAIMRMVPWAFFGKDEPATINDTRTDPALILGLDQLIEMIDDAQKILQGAQISVRDHAPRQLIPMNIMQLTGSAVDVVRAEIDND